MRSALIAASFATAAVASPKASLFANNVARDVAACMTGAQAQQVASNFKELIAAYSNATAEATLASNFQDYSSSVNTLINSGCTGPQNLDGPTFDSLTSFEAGQGSQPAIPFEQLNLWNNCDTVFLRWRSAQTPEPVTGNIILEAVPNPTAGSAQPWLIETVYSEFDSGAWLVNLGVFKPTCPPPPPPSKRGLSHGF